VRALARRECFRLCCQPQPGSAGTPNIVIPDQVRNDNIGK